MQDKRPHHLVASTMAALLALFLAAGPASATTFTDVAPNHPFFAEIDDVSDRGVMNGWPDGTFRPTLQVTREALAVTLYREAGSPATTPPPSSERSFVDVRPEHAFYAEIEWAAAQGLVAGYATDYIDPEVGHALPEYRPGAPVRRQAVAAVLHRYAGSPAHPVGELPLFEDVLGGVAGPEHPFRMQIEWARTEELMAGWPLQLPQGEICVDYGCEGSFRPGANITRQSFAAVLSRLHQLVPLT